ncbi:MAG TPA: hypothetical protein VGI87_15450 [Solirubrobacteraceae bacterium]|jgi:hypothetical protein
MSTTAMTISPEDNRTLLDAVAAAFDASRTDDERRLFEAKREVVLALGSHPVLVAADDGLPHSEPGPAGRVMLAFSDNEAAAAWTQSRHPAAAPVELVSSAELAKGEANRKQWLQWLARRGARTVALNPAGPLGSVVHADELRTLRPRLLRRGIVISAEHPWLDLGAREAERARAGRLMQSLAAAIEHGDDAAFAEVEPQLATINEIGSLLWASELQFLSGRHKLAQGNAKDGLYQMIYGSFGWGRFGDAYRCIDGLLDAGGRLLTRDDAEGTWRRSYLDELTGVLENMDVGYRSSDVARLLAAARERR